MFLLTMSWWLSKCKVPQKCRSFFPSPMKYGTTRCGDKGDVSSNRCSLHNIFSKIALTRGWWSTLGGKLPKFMVVPQIFAACKKIPAQFSYHNGSWFLFSANVFDWSHWKFKCNFDFDIQHCQQIPFPNVKYKNEKLSQSCQKISRYDFVIKYSKIWKWEIVRTLFPRLRAAAKLAGPPPTQPKPTLLKSGDISPSQTTKSNQKQCKTALTSQN